MNPAGRKGMPKDCRGSAMLAALCLAMVFAISLSSYLALCYEDLYVSERNAMTTFRGNELAEAGVEQALYCLNNSTWAGWTQTGTTQVATMTMTSAGLSSSVGATALNYGNGVTGTVTVTVQNYNTSPSITSQATMSIPSPYGSGSATSVNSGTITYTAPTTSGATTAAPLFVNAVAATNGIIKFKTGGTIDSYNSNPPASYIKKGAVCEIITAGPTPTNWTTFGSASNASGTVFTATGAGTGSGMVYENYNSTIDVTSGKEINAGYSAIVLSQDNYASSATVRLKDATVKGFAVGYDYANPGSTNWFSYGTTGQLLGYSTASGTSIDTSRILAQPWPYQPIVPENVPQNYINLPKGAGTVSSDGYTINQTGSLGSNATTVTAPTVYTVGGGIYLSGTQTVTIQGPVVLISYGGLTITNTAKIALVNPQSSLQIFVEYGNISLGGTGITNSNPYPLPKKVEIIDTTNTYGSAAIGTAQPFYGVIYLPYMSVSVSNTGAAAAIYGSIIGQDVTFTGADPVLHYDMALRNPTSDTYSNPVGNPVQAYQYGAAFDNISAPPTYSSMVLATY